MSAVTASMVKELREKTDAPMMECKKALSEAQGDMAKAEEILRVKLGSKASKAASRIAAEGIVAIHVTADRKLASMLEINCETDFVAKNEEFQAFAAGAAKLIADQNPADVAALNAMQINGQSIDDVRVGLIGKIGENMSLRRFVRVEAAGAIAQYIHGGSKIGVLIDVEGGDEELGRDLAMHIAATKPRALNRDGVDTATVEQERSIARQKAAESGKPADIIEKMVEGSVQKFLKEVTLLDQPFVKDDKTTIENLLKQRKAQVKSFALYVVGEGIEKKESDFAAEVAAQAAAAR